MPDPSIIIFGLLILVMSVVVHEVSHGFVADLLGDPTARLAGRLTLNPISHLDLFGSIVVPLLSFMLGGVIFGWAKPVPYNPYNLQKGKWGPAYVAAAGPLSNFFMAGVFAFLLRTGLGGALLGTTFTTLALLIVQINIALGVINLIPIPPIDGSKILFAILPPHMQEIRHFLTKYSLFIIFFLLFFGLRFLGTPISLLTRLFLGS